MAHDHRPSATEVFRSVQGGVLSRGVYLSPGLDVVLKERERVVDVKDDLQYPVEFKDARLTPEVTHHELTSKKSLELFVSNVDKHIDSKARKVGENVYGISTGAEPRTHGFLSSIHCHMYATRTLHILHRDIKLQPSAVGSLQEIEESIQKCNYQSSNHFQNFFETFGSYVNHGVIRIGGMLMSIVHCNDIPEENFSRMAEAVKAVSSEALKQGSLPQTDSNGPGNANDVMGEVSGVSAEDLKKITVEFKSVGGPAQPVNLDDWVHQLQQNSDLWQVISRKSTPKPIWTLLEHHQDAFKNVRRLADAMQKEWEITLTKMSSPMHKETEEAAESSLTEWDIVTGEHIPGGAPNDEREELDPDGQHSWDTTMEPEPQTQVMDSGESISNPTELDEDLQDRSFEVISDEGNPVVEYSGMTSKTEAEVVVVDENPIELVEEESSNVTSESGLKESLGKERKLERVKSVKENREAIRIHIDRWIDTHKKIARQNIEASLRDLVAIKEGYGKGRVWEDEVMYLREVQRRLLQVTDVLLGTSNGELKTKTVAAMEKILDTKIDAARFPKIGFIRRLIAGVKLDSYQQKFNVTGIRHLMHILKIEVGQLSSGASSDSLRKLQTKLETTAKAQSVIGDNLQSRYDYVLFVSVLRCFCFNIIAFLFEHALSSSDFQNLYIMLEAHMDNFHTLKHKEIKQAYILSVALSCNTERHSAVRYALQYIPEELSKELSVILPKIGNIDRKTNFDALESKVHQTLEDAEFKLGLDTLSLHAIVCNMGSQLALLDQAPPMRPPLSPSKPGSPHDSVHMFLEALEMRQYYPQKLRYEDVIKLTSDVHDDFSKEPTSLPELPWYFIKHIIGLDSDTREKCHVKGDNEDDDDENEDDTDTDDEEDSQEEGELSDDSDNTYAVSISSVHPLDLIYVIFLCADDFLRQQISEKMSTCQYAIPFILPPSGENTQESNNVVLNWALRSITREFRTDEVSIGCTLADLQAPLVTFVGKEKSWKSKLLNKMLSPNQDTFWHRGLKGGNCDQRISQGMVDVAWYLPGADDKFRFPVTFANLRQNPESSEIVYEELLKSSTVTCLFVEKVNEELEMTLESSPSVKSIVIVMLYKKKNAKKTKRLKEKFHLADHQVISKRCDEALFVEVYDELRKSIQIMVAQESSTTSSLSTFARKVSGAKRFEVDDKKSYHGRMAAESILSDIDEMYKKRPENTKSEVLPLQSDVKARKAVARLEKELLRQKDRRESMRIEEYKRHKEEDKLQLHQKLLRKPVSDTFKYFLHCLLSLGHLDRKYFLQCLKLGLNKRSAEFLQPLYKKYEAWSVKEESPERDKEIQEIEQQLSYGSFGIEHFFREIAVLYENVKAVYSVFGEDTDRKSQDVMQSFSKSLHVYDILARAMAELLMEGTAIEIMDGDAITSPIAWLSKVFEATEAVTKSSIFKVSALGAQSCGKSTLLNTVFGIDFPVSSGRCTRGAYMQLVKVDDELKKTLKRDYVALIDSEGLMSRSKTDDLEFDNELATFIIGLSDLTLVVIKGEGTEMTSFLQLAVHVFIRMDIVGENQACCFVHQNMGAVGAKLKLATEIAAFSKDLDATTAQAAKNADQTDKYVKFTDVLHYNMESDNILVPGLWDGTQPMAKINHGYSSTMQHLKSHVINTIKETHTDKGKQMCSFVELRDRVKVLWGAIKHENFVFSFKNVYQLDTHKKLTAIFVDEQMLLQHQIRESIKLEEDSVLVDEQTPVKQLVEEFQRRLGTILQKKIQTLKKKIQHFFQCSGCDDDDCSPTVQNRYLLAPFENEFLSDVESLRQKLASKITASSDELRKKMETERWIKEKSTEYAETLSDKVKEIIKQTSRGLSLPETEEKFEEWWTKETCDILRKTSSSTEPASEQESIEAVVQKTLTDLLKGDDLEYRKRKLEKAKEANTFFMKPKYFPVTVFSNGHLSACEEVCNRLIEETKTQYNVPDGKKFNKMDAEALFKQVIDKIKEIQRKFQTTPKFKVEFLCHIEKKAVAGYKEMHQKYCNESSPEAILRQMKKGYFHLFMNKMGQGNVAADVCNTLIKQIIWRSINDYLNPHRLLADIGTRLPDIFKDVKSIEKYVVDNLISQNSFIGYKDYILHHDTTVKSKLREVSIKHFQDHLKTMAKGKLEDSLNKIKQVIDKPDIVSGQEENFLPSFFISLSNQGLSLSGPEIAAYLDFDVPDTMEFTEIVLQQLDGTSQQKNGALQPLNGALEQQDGTLEQQDGTLQQQDGTLEQQDGTLQQQDGTLQQQDGTLQQQDGTLQQQDGTLQQQDGTSLRTQKGETLKDILTAEIDSWDVPTKLQDMDFIEFIFMEIFGCAESCPFCRAPCDAHYGGKTHGRHSSMSHRPLGLIGQYDTRENKLVIEDCTYNIASNSTFRYGEKNEKSKSFSKYRDVYPDWNIVRNVNPDVDKIWKWVFAQHNDEFARYYEAGRADIPDEWARYDKDIVQQNVKEGNAFSNAMKTFTNYFFTLFSPGKATGRKIKKDTKL